MPRLEVGMVQGLLAADTLRRVEAEHFGEQINGEWVGVWIERGERDTRLDRQRTDIVLGLQKCN